MLRFLATVILLSLGACAMANGAMGLGLEMWDLRYWAAYVAVTVIIEAWLIGRSLGMSWAKSLTLSAVANGITGGLCGGIGLFAPVFHMTLVGSSTNPNPLMNSVVLLCAFAVPSALIEYFVWSWIKKESFLWRVVWVHLATVPLAMLILLLPPRPYLGLEATTKWQRKSLLLGIKTGLANYIATKGRIPNAATPEQLIVAISPYMVYKSSDSALGLYQTEYTRFSTGEDHTRPFEFNKDLVGRRMVTGKTKWVWYVRPGKHSLGDDWGLAVETGSGEVRLMRNGEVFGLLK